MIRLLKDKLFENHSAVSVKYIIVGYGELESKIRTYVHTQRLDEMVKIVINPPNVTDYLEDGHIYLSTSLLEGLSNSIMEALEFSLPIIAMNVDDNDKLVLEGENVFLTNMKDTKTIANKLLTLLDDSELRNVMGQTGYAHLANVFSISTFKNNYISLISKLNDTN